jgi:hypothetical protein
MNDIWDMTNEARILLADLTGKNPNVLYELGLAHAIAKPVVMVVEDIDDVPFDLRSLRVIEYDKNHPGWGRTLKMSITNSITEALESPAQYVLPTFLAVTEGPPTTEVSAVERDVLDLRSEVDSLRRLVVSQRRNSDRQLESRDVPGPQEAAAMIGDWLSDGMPPEVIIQRLRMLGVPSDFVEEQIDQRLRG